MQQKAAISGTVTGNDQHVGFRAMILRQAIERGYRAYDFLRGDEAYKVRFGARPRPTFGWRIVPPRVAAQVRHNLWLAGNNVKQWIKKRGKVEKEEEEEEEKVISCKILK